MTDYAKIVADTSFLGRHSINERPNVCTENDFANRVLATSQRLNFPAEN